MNSTSTLLKISNKPAIHTYFDVVPESPDGEMITWFAFHGKPLTEGAVIVSDITGKNQVKVMDCIGNPHCGARQGWLDNEHIYFSAQGSVFVAHRNGSIVNKISGSIDTIHQGSRRGLSHSNCIRKYGGTPPDKEACYRIDIDTGEMKKILSFHEALALLKEHADLTGVPEESLSFKHTKWAPDGKQWFVVFNNVKSGRTIDNIPRVKVILAADENGDDLRYIDTFGHHPNWLPDSSGIYAFSENRKKTIYSWDTKGGNKKVLAKFSCEGHPCVSPDERYITTDGHDYPENGKACVILKDLSIGHEELIAEMDSPAVTWQTDHPPRRVCHPHPAWSSDSTRLYFNMIENELPYLYSMKIDR
jgi:hypothetical protein